MGIYSKYIFPRLLDWSLGAPEMGKYRRRALEGARGRTLEIGFGTGLNMPWYPEGVTELVVFDSENMLPELVEERVSRSAIPVTRLRLDASGRLPFDDRSFDSVVTTFTLCSIGDLAAALSEVHRVLKPSGGLHFLEHGRSDDRGVASWQDRLNPLQKIVGVGCNMNRPIDRLIREAGFGFTSLERFLMPKTPRLLAEMYQGIAHPTTD
ncbi:MAG: class I SAM-dependent methyltransferase [Blastocatellales bacterium]